MVAVWGVKYVNPIYFETVGLTRQALWTDA